MQRVVVETTGWLRGDAEVQTVEVQLSFEPSDPFAVTVSIDSSEGPLSWVFSRDLLADGLRSMIPVGAGRVRVQATSVLTEISWDGAEGEPLVLRLPWWNTREFVRQSQAEVPRGQETCDVDGWVAALTAPQEP